MCTLTQVPILQKRTCLKNTTHSPCPLPQGPDGLPQGVPPPGHPGFFNHHGVRQPPSVSQPSPHMMGNPQFMNAPPTRYGGARPPRMAPDGPQFAGVPGEPQMMPPDQLRHAPPGPHMFHQRLAGPPTGGPVPARMMGPNVSFFFTFIIIVV